MKIISQVTTYDCNDCDSEIAEQREWHIQAAMRVPEFWLSGKETEDRAQQRAWKCIKKKYEEHKLWFLSVLYMCKR